jgi:hypothetical protein
MRKIYLEEIKLKIESCLRNYLCEEGMLLYLAANDNINRSTDPLVELHAIEDIPLEGSRLLSEIKVILSVLGKPWQCELLVQGIYEALQPHHITHHELAVLLMSLHVEALACQQPRLTKKRAVVKYIVEGMQPPHPTVENDNEQFPDDILNAEYC